MKNTKKVQVPLSTLGKLDGTWTLSQESGTQQLKLAKEAAEETARLVAEIVPPIPAQREPWVGYQLKNVQFSGVIATAVPDSMDIYIYRTQFGGTADQVAPKITVEKTGVPSAVGGYALKAGVDEAIVQGETKYYAVLQAGCGSTDVLDVRGVMAEFVEVDDTNM